MPNGHKSSSELKIRQKLGKYRIERRLGAGGFAESGMDNIHRVVDVTFWGTLNAIKAALKPMLAQQSLDAGHDRLARALCLR